MRIMAIDYGDARIGLAVSDPTGLICGEAWTMEEWNMERAAARICEEAAKRGARMPETDAARDIERVRAERQAFEALMGYNAETAYGMQKEG